MKFDKLAEAYLKILTESHDEYLPGQWIGDNYIILGKEQDGKYNVGELGEQDVYPASELEDTGTTVGGDQIMTWTHTGEDIIVSNDKTEEGDYVGLPIVGGFLMTAEDIAEIESEGEYDENAEDKKETSQEWELKRHAREQNKWDKRKERWDAFKKANPGYKKNS